MDKYLDRSPMALMAVTAAEEAILEERFLHRPVLLRETVQYLAVMAGRAYIDCTVGEGGHASAILQAAMPGGRLLGIDLDAQALEHARRRLQSYGDSLTLAQNSYAGLGELAHSLEFSEPDGILLDLGLSSLQLQTPERGFSLQRDEPLDMRYDRAGALDAAYIVNNYSVEEMADVLASFGEEPRAQSIARAIAQNRPLETTLQLANLVTRVIGKRRGRIHPATRTFQALRIAVNSEMDNLKAGLQHAFNLLKPGGRLVVISYHSLEDRIVKESIRREARGCICAPGIPVCTCGQIATLKVITRKVVTSSPEEIRANPRSRSARMRAAERLQDP